MNANWHQFIIVMGRVFAQESGVQSKVESYQRLQKMVFDAALLSTQHYMVRIQGKWSNPGKRVRPPLHLGVVAKEKKAFGLPSTKVANFTYDCSGR